MPLVDARYYKALLISPNKTVASEVAPLLAYGLPLAPIHDINAYPNGRQLAELLQSVEPKLCFLDFSTEAQAFELLGELRSTAATLPIIALLNANKPDLVLQCMRQGATDFLI